MKRGRSEVELVARQKSSGVRNYCCAKERGGCGGSGASESPALHRLKVRSVDFVSLSPILSATLNGIN